MKSSWLTDTGTLACRWAILDVERPRSPQEDSYAEGRYLPPAPDFASHSPFGGAYWFQPFTIACDSEGRPLGVTAAGF
jgi:hypothetical protein